MKTRNAARAFLISGLVVLGAAPAVFAGAIAITGSTTSHSGGTFFVSDTKADGHSAYGNWGGTSGNRLQNNSGSGTTVSRFVGTVGAHRSCVDQFGPDPCSAYGL